MRLRMVGLLLLLVGTFEARQAAAAAANDVRAFLTSEGLLAQYDRLARVLALRAGTQPAAYAEPSFVLPHVARALADPLGLEAQARAVTERAWAAVAGSRIGTGDLLALAADLLDRPLAPASPAALFRPGATPGEHLASIERLFDDVRRLRDEAFAELTSDDRAFVTRALEPFLDRLARHPVSQAVETDAETTESRRLLALAGKVDLAKLLDAARLQARLAEPEALVTLDRDLLRALPRLPRIRHPLARGDLRLVRQTRHGAFVVGGPGPTTYRGDAALVVDLGGANRYENNAGAADGWERPVSAVLDFGQGTTFVQRDRPSQGAGRFGLGLLVTTGDGVRYFGGRASQGAGLFGVGLLVALGRRQRFAAQAGAQGAGLAGVGILLAANHENEFAAGPLAQGAGGPNGVGVLLNRGGSSLFRLAARALTDQSPARALPGLGQGVGTGYRNLAAGGVGMLLAGGWRNALYAGEVAQGGGQARGLGILDLRGGEHSLRGGPHAQGFGLQGGVGLARVEHGGNALRAPREAQGIGTDAAIGMLLVGGERNHFEIGSIGQGAGVQSGIGLLHVTGGGNTYAGDAARGHGSLGIWLSPEGRRAAYRGP